MVDPRRSLTARSARLLMPAAARLSGALARGGAAGSRAAARRGTFVPEDAARVEVRLLGLRAEQAHARVELEGRHHHGLHVVDETCQRAPSAALSGRAGARARARARAQARARAGQGHPAPWRTEQTPCGRPRTSTARAQRRSGAAARARRARRARRRAARQVSARDRRVGCTRVGRGAGGATVGRSGGGHARCAARNVRGEGRGVST